MATVEILPTVYMRKYLPLLLVAAIALPLTLDAQQKPKKKKRRAPSYGVTTPMDTTDYRTPAEKAQDSIRSVHESAAEQLTWQADWVAGVTQERYQQIELKWSRRVVDAMLGPARLVSQRTIANIRRSVYEYGDKNTGPIATITFESLGGFDLWDEVADKSYED